jgi:hypothetical protein
MTGAAVNGNIAGRRRRTILDFRSTVDRKARPASGKTRKRKAAEQL